MTVDTQKDKFYYVIRAWGRGMRSRKIASGEVASFTHLEQLERARWRNEDANLPDLSVRVTAIDSGGGMDDSRDAGTRTWQVYKWCAARPQKRLIDARLPLPGYEMILKAAHAFNLLDARGAISVTERAAYIGRIRTLSRLVAQAYVDAREALGFPMLPPELRRTAA